MGYSLYKLRFSTAVHIGSSSGGPSLGNAQMTIHADTLFSALCSEAAKQGNIEQLVEYFASATLTISDALPYHNHEIFLPKPIIYVANKKNEGDSGLKKKLKSLEYIPLSMFTDYLKGITAGEVLDLEKLDCSFGHTIMQTRVAIKDNVLPLPYYVAGWKFAEDCGLYVILDSKIPAAEHLFESLLENLGWTGIGGKQSSGWGKFDFSKLDVPATLESLLNDNQAEYQMLLGTGLPVETELDSALQKGWYALVRRGGFIRSDKYAGRALKKRTIYMLAPGSCLGQRFQGGMFDLSNNGAHPVWRLGHTLFAGVNL